MEGLIIKGLKRLKSFKFQGFRVLSGAEVQGFKVPGLKYLNYSLFDLIFFIL